MIQNHSLRLDRSLIDPNVALTSRHSEFKIIAVCSSISNCHSTEVIAHALTPNEYDLLRILVAHAGKVLTHRQLLREVWGTGYDQEFHILHVNISNLRRKIEPDPARPQFIITEPGVGYRLRTS